MLREVQELQKEAVKGILKALKKQNEVTFIKNAPTRGAKQSALLRKELIKAYFSDALLSR